MSKDKLCLGQGVVVIRGPFARAQGRIQNFTDDAALIAIAGVFPLDDRPDKGLWRIGGELWIALEDLAAVKE